MTNRLLTVKEAATDLQETTVACVQKLQSEGVPDAEIAKGLSMFFAALGGFPPEGDASEVTE